MDRSLPIVRCTQRVLGLLLGVLVLRGPLSASEEPPRFAPARLGEEVRASLEALRLPLSDGKGPLAIRCGTRVLSNGDSMGVVCYPDPERGRLVQRHSVRITRALFGKEFSPARVDGEPVWSWFNFSVVIFEADGETRVRVLPHHGANVDHFGTADYTAPQRYTFPGWRCGLPRWMSRASLMLSVVRVSATGEALEVRFAHGSTPPACLDRLHTVLENSRYIPATRDGRAAEALYLEFIDLAAGSSD